VQVLIATQNAIDLRKVLRLQGDDCRTMGNVWIVETAATVDELYRSIVLFLPPGERVIVAPLSRSWRLFGTNAMDDCFER